MMNTDPIGILLVKSDSKGHRLLFRYPYIDDKKHEIRQKFTRNTPYSLQIIEDTLYRPNVVKSKLDKLTEFSDELLSTLLAVKSKFSENKFELKVNDIRFIGHPTLIQQYSGINSLHGKVDSPSCILVHVVFALRASADYSIVKSYYDLSKRLGVAIRHEEKRCGYFGKEMKLMMAAHDMEATRYCWLVTKIGFETCKLL